MSGNKKVAQKVDKSRPTNRLLGHRNGSSYVGVVSFFPESQRCCHIYIYGKPKKGGFNEGQKICQDKENRGRVGYRAEIDTIRYETGPTAHLIGPIDLRS